MRTWAHRNIRAVYVRRPLYFRSSRVTEDIRRNMYRFAKAAVNVTGTCTGLHINICVLVVSLGDVMVQYRSISNLTGLWVVGDRGRRANILVLAS